MSAGGAAARARAQGWRLEGAPEALEVLAAEVLADPAAALARGRVLRATTDRTVGQVTLGALGQVLLKVQRARGLPEAVRALLRPSRARAEWTAARALRERGVAVPEPLALAERGGVGAPSLTVYAARFLPDVEPLLAALRRRDAAAAGALLERVGALVRQMQAAGFDHGDLHAGNLLVGGGPTPALHLIDLHRGRLADPARSRAEAALVPLLAGLEALPLPERAARLHLLRGWLAGGSAETLEARLAPRVEALRRAQRRKHDAWALTACPWQVTVTGRLVGVRDTALPERTIEARLEAHDAALAAGDARVLKDRPKSAVTRHGDVIVKETRLRGWRAWLKRLLTPGRIVAGHVNAHRLFVRDIPTARSLACVRRGRRRFTLYQDLSALPRLDDLVRGLYAGRDRAAQARLREASAAWLADLHARGVYHGDVKSLHVLVRDWPDAPRFVLIDTDRLKLLAGRVGQVRRLKNLAQLDASIPVSVTRAERLRWWRAYAERLGAGDDEREIARRLSVLLARKRRVVHEPLE